MTIGPAGVKVLGPDHPHHCRHRGQVLRLDRLLEAVNDRLLELRFSVRAFGVNGPLEHRLQLVGHPHVFDGAEFGHLLP